MSRIGNNKILIPKKVKIILFKNKYNKKIIIKGPLGILWEKINCRQIKILINSKYIFLKNNNTKMLINKSLHGLYRTLINNMIIGVTKGYKKILEIRGIEYKILVYNNHLELDLGYSHNILIDIPSCINIKIKNINNQYIIKCFSYNKVILGIYCSMIKSLKKPDVYKGKGIRYLNEYVFKKNRKTV
ncbi:MAG: 50S ribosomal protein L6 [Candidatus Shikimatogenerans sp. AspAUS03]|uniref:50S ribosomal protein L6 n=1 Tax=Candidatus Shikimatogenerans sp. AspAUS03 TaxID=3158563 RepID=A0AAU7QSP3_9FLAO